MRLGRAGRGGVQVVDVAQPLALGAQRVVLPRLGLERVERLDQRLELGQVAGPLAGPRERVGLEPPGLAERAPGVGHAGAELGAARAPGGVEQVELHRGPGEPPGLVLGHDLDQSAAGRLEVGPGAASPPHERARTPVGDDPPGQHELVGVVGAQVGQDGGQRPGLDALERGLDVGLAPGRADQRGIGLAAEQQADRLGQDRLAGARLAGDHRQPRRELELGAADENEVVDAKKGQHRSHDTEGVGRSERTPVRMQATLRGCVGDRQRRPGERHPGDPGELGERRRPRALAEPRREALEERLHAW